MLDPHGCTETFMHEDAVCQHHRDSTYTVPYVSACPICASARPLIRRGVESPDGDLALPCPRCASASPGVASAAPPTLRVSTPGRTRMPSSRHTIMYCVKGVNQKSFSGSKAVAVRTPVRTSSCQSLFLESSAAGCPPGGRALQGGPAVLGRVAASAITVWKSAL